MKWIARAGFAVAAVFLALTALFTPQRVTPSHSNAAPLPIPLEAREPIALPRNAPDDPDPITDDTDAMIDLYGNDVSPAVATYSFDALGSLYEVHSPQTELPRLGSPKT